MKKRYVMVMVAVAAATWITTAQAMDTFLVGPRAMGMAGANVASVDNNAAQYYNPAAFGFFGRHNEDETKSEADTNDLGRKDFGFDVYAGGGWRMNDNFGDYLTTLSAIDLDELKNGIQTETELAGLINLVGSLNGIDELGTGMTVDVNAGTSLRIKHFGIGVRGYTQANAVVLDIDNQHLGLNIDPTDLRNGIENVDLSASSYNSSQTYNFFDSTTQASLVAQYGAEAVNRLAFIAIQENVDPASATNMTTTLVAINNSSSTSTTNPLSIDNNTTTVSMTGFGFVEVPLSYGYAINDNVSVGGNLKFMKGRVYGSQVLVFDDESNDILAQSDENSKETTTLGLDLGVMARYGKFNFGLVGRNLNSPKFDGFTIPTTSVTIDSVTLKPQVTAGVAFIPWSTLTLEADYDITKNEAELFDTQNLALGVEWDAFRFLALRAGAMKNLAESDLGLIYTAGVGLNVWLVRFDIAGAASLGDKVIFDGEEVPKFAKVSAQASIDF